MTLTSYIQNLWLLGNVEKDFPWKIIAHLDRHLKSVLGSLDRSEYEEPHPGCFIHKTATIEHNVTLKPPLLIGPGCFIAANCYLRGPIILAENASLGPSCEVKCSFIGVGSRLAHMNYVGNSIIGEDVNLEGGAVCANHWNEYEEKEVRVRWNNQVVFTGSTKFGAILGDHCRLGANSVTDPGTVLKPSSIVGRLEHISQEDL